MAAIRPLLPGEADGLAGLDSAFTTQRIYHAQSWADERGLGIELLTVDLDEPLTKRYEGVAETCDRCSRQGLVVALDDGGRLGAVIACSALQANRTVRIETLCVEPGYRRQGIGQALVERVIPYARGTGARALMAEAQNLNYPAVQFLLATGWRFCGASDRHYPPPDNQAVALFFSYNLEAE